MEKKEIKMSLGTFVVSIIAVILLIVVVGMGVYIANQNNKEDVKQDEIQNISNKENVNNSTTTNINKTENVKPKNIVINRHVDFCAKEGYGAQRKDVDSGYIDVKDKNKYEDQTYYLYIKNKSLGNSIVKTEDGAFDDTIDLNYLDLEDETFESLNIALDVKYDAIPRKSTVTSITAQMKNNIKELSNYTDFQAEKIDLDGDGTYEYIIVMQNKSSKALNSKIIIVNEDGNKIADLVNILNGCWGGYEDSALYAVLDWLIYIDLDNDGKMEIFTELPGWEWLEYTVFKYDNGKIIGDVVERDLSKEP